MLNILADKQKWCKQFGILIEKSQWDSSKLPATFITDMGSEYKSETFEQIAEVGCTIINLPSYRPELKGSVEKIILKCIIYYNSKRIIENYPYSEAMLSAQVKPFACNMWEWGKTQNGANLITIDKEQVILTLLPRTVGRFTRSGLKVNRIRYKNMNYTEKYLSGGDVSVAYNPDDVSCVWLMENGSYIPFELIENGY